jgi:large subunit ribosomal protein L19
MDARNPTGVKPSPAIESFRPGDTVTVNVKIREGERERVQAFRGDVLIGRYNQGDTPAPGATFIVRRISYGVGVERIFPYCSPMIESVKLVRKGKVRRARLYYLRGLTGKAARIKERRGLLQAAGAEVAATPAEVQPASETPAPETVPATTEGAAPVTTAQPAAEAAAPRA